MRDEGPTTFCVRLKQGGPFRRLAGRSPENISNNVLFGGNTLTMIQESSG